MLRITLAICLLFAGPAPLADAVVSSCPRETQTSANGETARAADTPFAEGLFFRIVKQGAAPSHIFGTIHLDYPQLTRLPPQVGLALLQSSRLVMETSFDEEAELAFRERMVLPEDEALTRWLSGDMLARYDRLLERYEVPEALGHRLKPWAATGLIGRPKPTSGRTMEDALRENAVRMGKPVYALETMDELIAAQEEQPIDEQITVLADTICQHPRILQDVGKLIAWYGAGNLAAIAQLNESGHEGDALFQRMNERMLYRRSEVMAQRLQEHLHAGGALIAVGALHLTGERGILNLLEGEGYTITGIF